METKSKKQLEKEYNEAVKKAKAEIKEKIIEANKLLKEAEKICEKYGVAVYISPSPVGQTYQPESLNEKWGELFNNDDEDYACDYGIGEHDGWQHSAVC